MATEAFCGVFGAIFLKNLLQYLDEKEHANVEIDIAFDWEKTNVIEKPKYNTQQLMVSTLTQIGCQPTVNDDDTVSVSYQGEHFHIDFLGLNARIWDLKWAEVNANDSDLPKIREAANHTNFGFGPTVVLSDPDDEGTIYLHSRHEILLHPEMPEIEDYLRSNLDRFFGAKEEVRKYLEQQRARERRRPIGFNTTVEPTDSD